MSSEDSAEHPGAQQLSEETSEKDALIRRRAHLLWESEGKPEGREEEYWHRAVELIDDEACAAYPPAQSRGHRT
jgi:hypothetical protein